MIDYKFITLPYLKNFKCSADKCLSTCCYGWNVKVDDKTYNAYKKLCNSFGDYITEHISENTKNIYMNKDYCPFLDSEQMCKIQKKYGPDMLCDVCKNYPRTKKYLINMEKSFMVLSCPEVIKAIKKANVFDEKTTIITIKGKETKKETLILKFYNYFCNKIKFIYNKKANLYKTMYVLLSFAYDSEIYFKQKLTEKNIEEFNNKFNEKYFKSLYKNYKTKKCYDFINTLQVSLVKETVVNFSVLNKILKSFFKDYTNLDFNNINFKSLNKKTTKLLNKNTNLYNILFYILNYRTFNIIIEKNFISYINCSIIFITLIQALSISSFLNDNLNFYKNSLILISNLYRYIYHSKNLEDMIKKFKSFNFSNKENLFKYLTSF